MRNRSWIELNLKALHYNRTTLQVRLPLGTELMPAVKANAYGHGAVEIASELQRHGVSAFCVAAAEEGVELRQHGIRGEILILGYTDPDQIPDLVRWDLTQSVFSLAYAGALAGSAAKVKVHLKIDTGMHRLGIPWDDREQLQRVLFQPNLQITGVFTHLWEDDLTRPEDRTLAFQQAERFQKTVRFLRECGVSGIRTHLLASAGIAHMPEAGGDLARPGIALYGVWSTREDMERSGLRLQPVLSLKARIVQIRELPPGEGAGYGHAFSADRPVRLAAVSIGYADGLPRSLSCGAGSALIRGRKVPIAGRICMDQTLLDVTEVPDAAMGDIAVFLGRSGDEEITACDMARQAGTISNEILSRLGPRLERICLNQEKSG